MITPNDPAKLHLWNQCLSSDHNATPCRHQAAIAGPKNVNGHWSPGKEGAKQGKGGKQQKGGKQYWGKDGYNRPQW